MTSSQQVSSPHIRAIPRPTARLIGSAKSSLSTPSSPQAKVVNTQVKSTSQTQTKASGVQIKSPPNQIRSPTTQIRQPTSQIKGSSQIRIPNNQGQSRVVHASPQNSVRSPSQSRTIKHKTIQEKNLTQMQSRSPQFSPIENPRISLSTQFRSLDSRLI